MMPASSPSRCRILESKAQQELKEISSYSDERYKWAVLPSINGVTVEAAQELFIRRRLDVQQKHAHV